MFIYGSYNLSLPYPLSFSVKTPDRSSGTYRSKLNGSSSVPHMPFVRLPNSMSLENPPIYGIDQALMLFSDYLPQHLLIQR